MWCFDHALLRTLTSFQIKQTISVSITVRVEVCPVLIIQSMFFTFLPLFLQSGIDVYKKNSHEQTALDIVNKFTPTRAAQDIKQLLRGELAPTKPCTNGHRLQMESGTGV